MTAVDQEGRVFVDTVVCLIYIFFSLASESASSQGPGDLWYFPPGVPHSLQATSDNPEGSEFLLVPSLSLYYSFWPLTETMLNADLPLRYVRRPEHIPRECDILLLH